MKTKFKSAKSTKIRKIRKKLELEFNDNYSKSQMYVLIKQGARSSTMLDALVHYYIENLDNLVDIDNGLYVKVSYLDLAQFTEFRSRDLCHYINVNVKSNFITRINNQEKGVMYYALHIDSINEYLKDLESEFKWFEPKTVNHESDTNNFMKSIEIKSYNSGYDFQQKDIFYKVFTKKDVKGAYIYIKKYGEKMYQEEYIELIKRYSPGDLEKLRRHVELENDEDLRNGCGAEVIEWLDMQRSSKSERQFIKEKILIFIYDKIGFDILSMVYVKGKECGISIEPANKDISTSNWEKFYNVYYSDPNGEIRLISSSIDYKGQFISLPEYLQEYLITAIYNMKEYSVTITKLYTFISALTDYIRNYD